MSLELVACQEEEKGQFPAYVRLHRNTHDGSFDLVVSEHGLMSPVAKLTLTRSEAKRFFFAAWSATLDPED